MNNLPKELILNIIEQSDTLEVLYKLIKLNKKIYNISIKYKNLINIIKLKILNLLHTSVFNNINIYEFLTDNDNNNNIVMRYNYVLKKTRVTYCNNYINISHGDSLSKECIIGYLNNINPGIYRCSYTCNGYNNKSLIYITLNAK